ncbi:MAG: phosphodiester glycosidase family protein, partial [Luteolibacter sp.]
MRYLIPGLFALPFVSCAPTNPAPPVALPVLAPATSLATPSPAPAASAPVAAAKVASREISGILFKGITFDSRNYQLVVVDQANGPGSEFADAAEAARAHGGVAGINAGFFTPEGAPLGWVVSSGKISGTWNAASSLGSGIWHRSPSGSTAISRREHLGRNAAAGMHELIQAGPLLVENRRAVSGLESTKTSARSLILCDGGTRWWVGCSSPCTLDALAQALAEGQPAGW